MTEIEDAQADNGTGHIFEEKLSERIPMPASSGTPAANLNQLSIDTQAGDSVRNSASEYLALHTPDKMIPEVAGPQRVARTLPGR
jgi:hypothetical protein